VSDEDQGEQAPAEQSEQGSIDFEQSLSELEKLVERLEQSDLSLEESLRQFERGVELTRTCQKALDQAELKVRKLTENTEDASLEPFDTGEGDGETGDPGASEG